MKKLQLFPTPQTIEYRSGTLPRPGKVVFSAPERILSGCRARGWRIRQSLAGLFDGGGPEIPLKIRWDALGPEAFRLTICPEGIVIACSADPGAYYAVGILAQILDQCGEELPCVMVESAPALPLRGLLLDVGRDKIPTMETLFGLIDKLSAMCYNHLQLYIEGYAFAWPGYEYLFPEETPFTPEELRALDQYAWSRYIELVPSMNILGHMEKWLEKPQLRHLAECEDGYLFQNLYPREPMTLNARDSRSLDFVVELLDELAACFRSRKVNVNMDEPFELGLGKNAAYVAEHGKGKLYLDFLLEVHQAMAQRGKTLLMWGDVVFSHPQYIPRLPGDILLLDWMYEGEGDFAPHARTLAESGRDFCLCPGSSSWCSYTGRSDCMRKNVQNAVQCAVRYGARGILLTDWGDLGHWQYLSTSYPAFAWAAACAWSGEGAGEEELADWSNRYLYGDASGQALRLALDMGNYYQLEHAPLYSTTLCAAVMCSKYRFHTRKEFGEKLDLLLKLSANLALDMEIPPKEPVIALQGAALARYLEGLDRRLEGLELEGEEGPLLRREMAQSLRFARHGLRLYLAMTGEEEQESFAEKMEALFEDLDGIMQEHWHLWRARNRSGGYKRSSGQLFHLLRTYAKLAENNRSAGAALHKEDRQ